MTDRLPHRTLPNQTRATLDVYHDDTIGHALDRTPGAEYTAVRGVYRSVDAQYGPGTAGDGCTRLESCRGSRAAAGHPPHDPGPAPTIGAGSSAGDRPSTDRRSTRSPYGRVIQRQDAPPITTW